MIFQIGISFLTQKDQIGGGRKKEGEEIGTLTTNPRTNIHLMTKGQMIILIDIHFMMQTDKMGGYKDGEVIETKHTHTPTGAGYHMTKRPVVILIDIRRLLM